MTSKYLIKQATLINEGKQFVADVFINNQLIEKIDTHIEKQEKVIEINAQGKYLLPGMIDDQVHFREPGFTHKAEIYTEAKAAVAGGITSFMEMPNTFPTSTTIDLLEHKYERAAHVSLANFSFYMGTTHHNIEEIKRVNPKIHCGVKVFMGSSTGDMLVDDDKTLEELFANAPTLIASHCESDDIIRQNADYYKSIYGEAVPFKFHPKIRSAEACFASSKKAIELAKKHDARLHILHISTALETQLFDATLPLKNKKITSEACIHHLWFSDEDYEEKGAFIKWNPAVKTAHDRAALWEALLQNKIDVIATDHAPHTLEEKKQNYFKSPSGGPLVQHALPALLECYLQGKISLTDIVQKACHNVAILFEIEKRGFIKEGYFADLVLVNLKANNIVTPHNILYKCKWSPFENQTFHSEITHTFVSGHLAYQHGVFDESSKGLRMMFVR